MSTRIINGVEVNMNRYDRKRYDEGKWKPKVKKPVEPVTKEIEPEDVLKTGENETLTETKNYFKGDHVKTK